MREHLASTLAIQMALAIDKLATESPTSTGKSAQVPKSKTPLTGAKAHPIPLKGSFLVWHKDKKFHKADLDPNYLVKIQFRNSSFHQSIHRFIDTFADVKASKAASGSVTVKTKCPLFHIDIHGKKDRSYNSDIDLGILAMKENFLPED